MGELLGATLIKAHRKEGTKVRFWGGASYLATITQRQILFCQACEQPVPDAQFSDAQEQAARPAVFRKPIRLKVPSLGESPYSIYALHDELLDKSVCPHD